VFGEGRSRGLGRKTGDIYAATTSSILGWTARVDGRRPNIGRQTLHRPLDLIFRRSKISWSQNIDHGWFAAIRFDEVADGQTEFDFSIKKSRNYCGSTTWTGIGVERAEREKSNDQTCGLMSGESAQIGYSWALGSQTPAHGSPILSGGRDA